MSPQRGAESGLSPTIDLQQRGVPNEADPRVSAIEVVLGKIERVRHNGKQHLASCPVATHGQGNGDRNPSLSVTEDHGKVLLNCMSGCHTQDVLTAMGLDWPDLFDEPLADERGVMVARWTYHNREGQPHTIVERWETPRGKSFRQYGPDGTPKLPEGHKPLPFKLPQVMAAAREGKEIWFVEGEKCVSAAESLGLVATTAPGGVNGWRPYFTKAFVGSPCVNIVADNDEVGRAYAFRVAADCRADKLTVRLWAVRPSAPKADLFDHVRAGFGLADLVPLRMFRPAGLDGDVLMTQEFPAIEWVVKDLIPLGFTVLGGAPKTGKSYTALDCAVNVERGGRFLHDSHCEPGSVLYLSLDNDAMWRIQMRLRHLALQYGIPPTFPNIEFHTEFPYGELAVKGITEWCNDQREKGQRPRLVVMDTLARIDPGYAGGRRDGGDDYGAVVENLSKWSRLAEREHLGVMAVHHIRKSGDDDWMNRYLGSQGIPATASTLMMIDTQRGSDKAVLHVASRDAGDRELTLWRQGQGWSVFCEGDETAPQQQGFRPRLVQGGA